MVTKETIKDEFKPLAKTILDKLSPEKKQMLADMEKTDKRYSARNATQKTKK